MISALLIAWSAVAGEWPPLTDEQQRWFKGLHNPSGFVCCDVADGHPIDQWDIKDGHYRAFFRGAWVVIPDEIVVKTPNLVGTATLWWGQFGPRCFVPGTGA
jgi:hypothetical protein